jgi:endopeptidase La
MIISKNKKEKKIITITKINTKDKSITEIQKLIQERICYIQEIIRNTILSIQEYRKIEVFSNNDTILCISVLNELFEKTVLLIELNSKMENEKEIDEVLDELQYIINKMAQIISNCGTRNIEDILFICMGSEMIKIESPILKEKWELIKKYCHPVSYKMIPWKQNHPCRNKDTTQKKEMLYCLNKITEETVILEFSENLECFEVDSAASKSIHYKINGIRIIFQNEKNQNTIIFSCIVDDIILDFFTNQYIKYQKNLIIENIPESLFEMKDVLNRFVESMTLKDILILGNQDVYKKLVVIMNDVRSVLINKLDSTIKRFIEMDFTQQRNMLIHLFLYQKDENIQYITYLLYDLITVSNNEIVDSTEKKELYDSFPWKIKTYFKDAMKLSVKYTHDMLSKYDINRITLEQQIFLFKAPEVVKEKAIAKWKEIKGKSDDVSNKSKQYLEGLLKIPFYIYREEPVLKMMKEMNKQFIHLYQKNEKILENFSIEKKEKYTNIEIFKYLQKIQEKIGYFLVEDIRKQISQFSSKQISIILQYLLTLYKNGKADFAHSLFQEINQTKTKQGRKELFLSLLEKWDAIPQKTEENIFAFYKIYDFICNPSKLSKFPMEIRDLTTNIYQMGECIDKISKVLDDSIYGHKYAKKQILKIISQWITGEQTGYCFGFEGSPGIGKTSLAKNGLANCLKDEDGKPRPFSFIALGGSCNGTTLEGHGYTYMHSTWGRIADILMESKCMNPIIYIDELDKVSKTELGKEIVGILMHLIDTTQNDSFQDKYFAGINLDLSKALFIFSYNDPEQIDRILLDRIHRIKFDNLSLEDKIVIVKDYILPNYNTKMGFSNTIVLTDEMIEYIIEHYTLEPGVRKLKEVLFDLYGEINIQLLHQFSSKSLIEDENKINDPTANQENEITIPIVITKSDLENKYLKKYHKIETKKINKENKIGVINGLYANALGKGGILPIEVVFFPSSSFLELRLTGLQGEVMKESMNVAKSVAWTLTNDEVKHKWLKQFENTKCQGLHIHCPEGAVSKDGPSAGTAITIAIYSLLNNRKIKNDIAITGEISLQGNVLAIGGLDAKVLGGIRSGVKTFIYPKENSRDFLDLCKKSEKKSILENIQFVEVSHIHEVFDYVLEEEQK